MTQHSQIIWLMTEIPHPEILLSQWGLTTISPGLYGMYLLNDDGQSYTTIANYQLDSSLNPFPSQARLACCCWAPEFSPFVFAANPARKLVAAEVRRLCLTRSAERKTGPQY